MNNVTCSPLLQCRIRLTCAAGKNSTGASKLIAPSARKLRNLLEEIEEGFEDASPLGPYESEVLQQVVASHAILQQLDGLLRAQRRSLDGTDPDGTAIADLKTALDVTSDHLAAAHETLSNTAKIELRLDTASLTQTPSMVSNLNSVSLFGMPRKLSTGSSVLSGTKDRSSGRSSITEATESTTSGAMETHTASVKHVATTLGRTSLDSRREPFSPWQSIFAPDPLSVPLEEASAFIMSDRHLPVVVGEEDIAELSTGDELRRSELPAGEPAATASAPATLHAPSSATIGPPRSEVGRIDAGASTAAVPSAGKADESAMNDNCPRPPSGPDVPSLAYAETVHSPVSGEPQVFLDAAAHTETESREPPDSTQSNELHEEPPTVGETECLDGLHESRHSLAETEARSTADECAARLEDSHSRLNNRPGPDEHRTTTCDEMQDKGETCEATETYGKSEAGEADNEQEAKSPTQPPVCEAESSGSIATAPPPPSRAPPPPPTPVIYKRASLPATAWGRYKITNATPQDQETDDSDDDLYRSSRPVSPSQVAALPDQPAATPSPVIPQVAINGTPVALHPSPEYAASAASSTEFSREPESRSPSPPSRKTTTIGPPAPIRRPVSLPRINSTKLERVLEESSPPALPPRPMRASFDGFAPALPPRPARSASTSAAVGPAQGGLEASALNTSSLRHNDHVVDPARSKLGETEHRRTQSSIIEYYASPNSDDIPASPASPVSRTAEVINLFNDRQWERAASGFQELFQANLYSGDLAKNRRIRHLVGVCALYSGHIQYAIGHFISVFRAPIKNVATLDEGDCAAAYWLGDAYALLNRRTEALIAYSLAERGPLFRGAEAKVRYAFIRAEEQYCQLGLAKIDFRLRWTREASQRADVRWSLLDHNLVSPSVVDVCFSDDSKPNVLEDPLTLARARWAAMPLSPSQRVSYGSAKVAADSLNNDAPWPLPFDPFFSMADVANGRLLAYECDIADIFRASSPKALANMVKKGPLGLTRTDCYTSSDVHALIHAVRQGLTDLRMEWSEVANIEGTCFVVRHHLMEAGIAQTYFFSISFFRQTFHDGFGVHVCPDGIRMARTFSETGDLDAEVATTEAKRLRKLILLQLEQRLHRRASVLRLRSPSPEGPNWAPPVPPKLPLPTT